MTIEPEAKPRPARPKPKPEPKTKTKASEAEAPTIKTVQGNSTLEIQCPPLKSFSDELLATFDTLALVALGEKQFKFSWFGKAFADAKLARQLERVRAIETKPEKKLVRLVAPFAENNGAPLDSNHVLVLHTEPKTEPLQLSEAGGQLAATLLKIKAKKLGLLIEAPRWKKNNNDADRECEAFLEGLQLRLWRFDEFRQRSAKDDPPLPAITVLSTAHERVHKALQATAPRVRATSFTRRLVSLPPNVLYPESFAEHVQTLADSA